MHICLFDIDGTLLSSGGAGQAAMEGALLREFGLPKIRARVPYSGRTDRAIVRDLLSLHDLEETPENLKRLVTAYLRDLPDSLTRHRGEVLPGIAGLLEGLQERTDVAVGLLTGNFQDGARLKLGHYNLYHYFEFGGFGDEHYDRDDVARAALDAVRSRLKNSVNLDRVWVIGDTPLDVRCARAIGAKVAAVATGWHSLEELAATKPDLLLADLSDPEPLLAHWS